MTDQTLRDQIEQTIFDRIVGVNCQHQHAARSAANAAAEALAAAHLLQQDGWRPIESAPKGPPLLVWDPYFGMRVGRHGILQEGWVSDGPYDWEVGGKEIGLNPTHWMPLPAVPVAPSPNSQSEGTSS